MRIKNTAGYNVIVFLVCSDIVVPKELESLVTVFDFPLPQPYVIKAIVLGFAREHKIPMDDNTAQWYSDMLKGLDEASIIRVLNKAYTAPSFNAPSFIDANKIQQGRRELIKDNGVLEIVDVDANVNMDSIGGYNNLKRYLRNKASTLTILKRRGKEGCIGLKASSSQVHLVAARALWPRRRTLYFLDLY